MSKIDEARKAYFDSFKANLNYDRLKTISKGLPKKKYTHRKRKQKESKHDKWQRIVLDAYIRARNLNEKWEKAAKGLTDKQSIKLMREIHNTATIRL